MLVFSGCYYEPINYRSQTTNEQEQQRQIIVEQRRQQEEQRRLVEQHIELQKQQNEEREAELLEAELRINLPRLWDSIREEQELKVCRREQMRKRYGRSNCFGFFETERTWSLHHSAKCHTVKSKYPRLIILEIENQIWLQLNQ